MHDEEQMIPLAEERLSVAKCEVLDGEVRVRSRTIVANEAVSVNLVSEEVEVERVPFETVVDVAPQIRTEGDVTIVPVLEERLVIEKRLVLVEEIRIRKRGTFHSERVEAELRKQSVMVERINADETAKEK